jgi:hypothetical protein
MWIIRYSEDGKNVEMFFSDIEGGILSAIEDFCSKGYSLHSILTISKENR